MRTRSYRRPIACGLALIVVTGFHNLVAQQSILPNESRIIAESIPLDDQVLSDSPAHLDISFQRRVRLVKLALYNERRDWVDIGFRYDPRPGMQFSWPVPALQPAEFYTAEWAALSTDEQLWRGSFSFSFGPTAEAPSAVRERLNLLLELRDGLPTLEQLQRLGLDPAEIRINNQPAPVFEPPFAPVLN